MSGAMSKSVYWLLAMSSLSACVGQGDPPGPPYEVVALDRVSPDSDEFALQRVQLRSIDDFEQLSAPHFRIRREGVLFADDANGDVIGEGSFEGDLPPALRYVVEDGVAVPRDYATLMLFSVAHQFERISDALPEVTTESVQAALDARGTVDVIVGPVFRKRGDGFDASLRLDTNAFFFAPGWQFGIAQSSEDEKAPLAADGRVIAHELGHAVFQTAFMGGAVESCDPADAAANQGDPWFPGRLEHELVIGGLNEGLSDWLSFAVTGGTDPIASIRVPEDPRLTNVPERVLTEDNFDWDHIVKEGDDGSAERRCIGKYCVGTLFARALVATYEAAGNALADEAARQAFSRLVVGALEGTRERMLDEELPAASAELARCEVRLHVSSEEDPPILGAFLRAFIQGFPLDLQSALCRQLAERFATGFPEPYRQECAP